MSQWTGDWAFNNVHSHNDGKTGSEEVEAANERAAKQAIRLKASERLFRTTMMWQDIKVQNVRKTSG